MLYYIIEHHTSITLDITVRTHNRARAPTTVAMRAPLAAAAYAALLLCSPGALVLCYQDERGYQPEDGYQEEALDV